MASFGETLKRERETRNISLREIAETTKINIRHLEALEADRFAALPGGVFNRGFVRAYADYLGIDADEAVRGFLAALSATGVASHEGVLPHPDRVAPRARRIATRTEIDPDIDTGAPLPRISMGADPRPAAAAAEDRAGDARAAVRRRVLAITFWVIIAGALLAGPLLTRRDRPPPPPGEAALGEAQFPAEPSAEQEAFEPPEGMFVDAGPAVPEQDGAGISDRRDAGQLEPEADPARTEAPPGAPTQPVTKGPPGASRSRPEEAEVGDESTAVRGQPPAARPKAAGRQSPPAASEVQGIEVEPAGPPPPAMSPPRASEPAPLPPGPLALEVQVTRETWLWLACDSQTRIDRRVHPGESNAMQCLRSIRVSAHDAGAIRLRVNGADCMPLGDDRARVYGYTIRFDDAHLICRSSRND
ncbi:MAG TPA: helix-turn-helix domain-containing protein [Candidatus Polarisedimenticolia bacterium]|nr:helix-turn-helix domain-containing protein [Candidatus Polarisedimenticolia bacterium]